MKFYTYIICWLGLLYNFLLAQFTQLQFQHPPLFKPGLQDSIYHQANFYDLSGSISALFEDEAAFSLWAGGNFNYIEGEFRSAFDSQKNNNQQYYIQLVKPLTEKDIFKGNFAYQRLVDKGVLWIHQTRMRETNTFILADSSRGNFILNGLFWNAEWAHQLPYNWNTGIGFYYNVDQRLKQNFPKPENIHRDIHVHLSLHKNWQVSKIGVAFRYYDEQEKVELNRYNLDQNLTPVLYKFRWSDLPIILLGKTSEERLISYKGYLGQFNLSRNIINNNMRILVNISYGQSKGSVVDGGSQPQDQGNFVRSDLNAQLLLHWNKSPLTTLQFYYCGNYRWYEAEPPEFELTAIKHPASQHHLILRFKRKLGRKSGIFFDLAYHNYWANYKDLMTVNSYHYQYHVPSLSLGWQHKIEARWEYYLWAGFRKFYYDQKSRTDNVYSEFFDYLFVQPYNFLTEKSAETGGGLELVYHYGPVLDAEFLMNYELSLPTDKFMINSSRYNFLLTILLKFYIL